MKIRPVGSELFNADIRTDRHDENIAFRNFAKAPKKDTVSLVIGIQKWTLE